MNSAIISAIISCVVSFFVGGGLTAIFAKVKGLAKREEALVEGVRGLLRSQLIEYHDKYMERGYCPVYAKEAARRSYEAYHELGGNGVITKLYNDIIALPESKEEKEKRKNA